MGYSKPAGGRVPTKPARSNKHLVGTAACGGLSPPYGNCVTYGTETGPLVTTRSFQSSASEPARLSLPASE